MNLKSKNPQIIAIVFLLILVGWGAVPGYLNGRWQWSQPLPVPTLKQLKNIRDHGLSLPDWQTRFQKKIFIGNHSWSVQEIQQKNHRAFLLLLPQNGPKDKPQVEWIDINGFHRWKTDSYHDYPVEINANNESGQFPSNFKIQVQFFRSWNSKETYAVVQWYAWFDGGNPAPSYWFFRDNVAQFSHHRVPWVAVSILLPIDPLDNIELHWPLAESLVKTVQFTLMEEGLKFQ